jgi:hypothetical protein
MQDKLGAPFLLDEIVKAGETRHGLYNNATGNLRLPNGQNMSLPLTSRPQGSETFVLRKPGMPAVVTTPEEAAAGHTWINYVILAGRNKTFYGKPVGLGWLYLDDAGTLWTVGYNVTVTGVTLTLTRPGHLQTIGPIAIAPALQAETADQLEWLNSMVVDLDSRGKQAVLTWTETDAAPHLWYSPRTQLERGRWYPRAMIKIQINGSPPAATATVTLLLDRANPALEGNTITDGTWSYTHTRWRQIVRRYNDGTNDIEEFDSGFQSYSTTDGVALPWPIPDGWTFDTGGNTEQQTHLWQRNLIISYTFDAADALQPVVFEHVQDYAAFGSFFTAPFELTPQGAGTYTETMRLRIGGVAQVFQRITTRAGDTQTVTGGPLLNYGHFVRYSNSLYGVYTTLNDQPVYYPPVSAYGIAAGPSLSHVNASLVPYASRNPINNDVAFSFDGVCYR